MAFPVPGQSYFDYFTPAETKVALMAEGILPPTSSVTWFFWGFPSYEVITNDFRGTTYVPEDQLPLPKSLKTF
jgi:hypothetical protein